MVVAGLAGKTPLDQAKVNMIALTLDDALFKHTARFVLIPDEQKLVCWLTFVLLSKLQSYIKNTIQCI